MHFSFSPGHSRLILLVLLLQNQHTFKILARVCKREGDGVRGVAAGSAWIAVFLGIPVNGAQSEICAHAARGVPLATAPDPAQHSSDNNMTTPNCEHAYVLLPH